MNEFSCSLCGSVWKKHGKTNCWSADPADAPAKPATCPSRKHLALIKKSFGRYRGAGEDARIAQVATQVEGLCYEREAGGALRARWTRVEDTVAFAKLMGYRRIGIATCIGLLNETERFAAILRAQGLEPLSVCCKSGSIDKSELGTGEEEKVRPGTFEPACNPVAQARLLNGARTDMNVIMGLCVGHDMLFSRHSKAPVTTLVVKDRVTGHNPAAALYGQDFYYKRLQSLQISTERTGSKPAGACARKKVKKKQMTR